jgi:hypothetical protein
MTRRAKRPSVKGMGADIFFSEVPSPSVPEGQEPTVQSEGPRHASKQASLPAAEKATPLELSDVERAIAEDALSRVAEAGRITASFRFTKPELDALDDLVYRARKRHGVRIPKQEIVRLGLASLLSEYKERGDKSVLGRYIMRLKAS